jgi:predicted chitinase
MSYIDGLSQEAQKNAEIFVKRMNANGITNPISQAGFLAVISKESGFIPKSERDYSGTSASRIRKIFSSKMGGLSDNEINTLKADPKAFFDKIYGGRYHNGPDEGFKYRGRGLNQITFKSAYEKYGKLSGHDIVNNPDSLNEIGVASDVAIAFMKSRMSQPGNKVADYNSTGINDFKSVKDSTGAFYHANTGWGKSTTGLKNETTGGYVKAHDRAPGLLDFAKKYTGQTIDLVKKKPIQTVIVVAVVVVGLYILISAVSSKSTVINNNIFK